MTFTTPRSSRSGRFAELALWSTAGLVVLTAHIAAAAVLLKQEPSPPADQGPPAAIMIEMAAEPVAQNTEEDQVSTEEVDSEEIASRQVEPVEEPLPEPLPEPVEPPPPEEVAELEPVKPEPEPVEPEPIEQPEPEITETIPEPAPEPVEEVDPLEQQMIAALDNVEVPLPIMRPPPPPEPKKEPPKRNDTGLAAVRFSFDGNGNITNVSLSRSSGNSAIDNYIVSAVKRASPIPAPPAGAPRYLDQGLRCE